VNFDPTQVAAFEGLEQEEKQDFAFALQEALNRDLVEFSLMGVNPTVLSCPTGFQVMSVIYDDGISLDALARRMSCLWKAEVAASICVNRHLGPLTDGGSAGQFDFRRLGIQ
jgi:hypothetical protein